MQWKIAAVLEPPPTPLCVSGRLTLASCWEQSSGTGAGAPSPSLYNRSAAEETEAGWCYKPRRLLSNNMVLCSWQLRTHLNSYFYLPSKGYKKQTHLLVFYHHNCSISWREDERLSFPEMCYNVFNQSASSYKCWEREKWYQVIAFFKRYCRSPWWTKWLDIQRPHCLGDIDEQTKKDVSNRHCSYWNLGHPWTSVLDRTSLPLKGSLFLIV